MIKVHEKKKWKSEKIRNKTLQSDGMIESSQDQSHTHKKNTTKHWNMVCHKRAQAKHPSPLEVYLITTHFSGQKKKTCHHLKTIKTFSRHISSIYTSDTALKRVCFAGSDYQALVFTCALSRSSCGDQIQTWSRLIHQLNPAFIYKNKKKSNIFPPLTN